MALGSAQDHLETSIALDSTHDLTDSPGTSHLEEMEEVDYESLPTDNLPAHLAAGAAAGVMEHCFMYPVDCVKVCLSFRCMVVCIMIRAGTD